MSKLSTAELVDAFKEMTLLDLTEFRKQFEETFDVTGDVAPQVVNNAPQIVEQEEEQTEFSVTLDAVGEQKIKVIKVVRELTSLGLAEAKALVDAAPKVVLDAVAKERAEDAATRLRAEGATVTLS